MKILSAIGMGAMVLSFFIALGLCCFGVAYLFTAPSVYLWIKILVGVLIFVFLSWVTGKDMEKY